MRLVPAFLSFLLLGCLAQAREIPFKFVNGYILLHARVNAQAVTLVLDSGASASVLSLDAARRLHLSLGKGTGVDGVGADGTAYGIRPMMATVDGAELGKIGLAIDLHNATDLCSERVDGLIGADFFKGRVTQIDYAKHFLRVMEQAPAIGECLPLRAQNGVFCMPVSVNGSKPRWTRLDTGCNDALHWVVRRTGPVRQKRGVSIGFITNTNDESLVTVKLGNLTLPHVETALHGSAIFPGEAGLVGSEVLAKYRVTIDARQGRIYLAQPDR